MVVIFDCDGVLVDSEIIANRVLAALLTRHGYPITAMESVQRFAGGTIPGVIKMVEDEGIDLPDDTKINCAHSMSKPSKRIYRPSPVFKRRWKN